MKDSYFCGGADLLTVRLSYNQHILKGRLFGEAYLVMADLLVLQGELTEVTKLMPPSTFS